MSTNNFNKGRNNRNLNSLKKCLATISKTMFKYFIFKTLKDNIRYKKLMNKL